MLTPDEKEASERELSVKVKKYGAIIKRLKAEYRTKSESDQQRAILGELFNQYITHSPKSYFSYFSSEPEDIVLVKNLQLKIHKTAVEDLVREINDFCKTQTESDLTYLLIAISIYGPFTVAPSSFNLKEWLQNKSKTYHTLLNVSRLPPNKLPLMSDPRFYFKKDNIIAVIRDLLNGSWPNSVCPVEIPLSYETDVLDYLLRTEVSNFRVVAVLRFNDIRFVVEYLSTQFKIQKEDKDKLKIINILTNLQPKRCSFGSQAMFDFLLTLFASKSLLLHEECYQAFIELLVCSETEAWASFLTDDRMLSIVRHTTELISNPKENLPVSSLEFLVRIHQSKKELVSIAEIIERCKSRLILLMNPDYSEFNMNAPLELAHCFEKAFNRKLSFPLELVLSAFFIPRTPDNFSIPSYRQFLHSIRFETAPEQQSDGSPMEIFNTLKLILQKFKVVPGIYMNSFHAKLFFITAERFNLGFINIIAGLGDNSACDVFFTRLLITSPGNYYKLFKEITTGLYDPDATKKFDTERLNIEFHEIMPSLKKSSQEVITCVELFASLSVLDQLQFQTNNWRLNMWKRVKYSCSRVGALSKLGIPLQKSATVEAASDRSFADRFDFIISPLERWLEKNETSTASRNIILEILATVCDLPIIEQVQANLECAGAAPINFGVTT